MRSVSSLSSDSPAEFQDTTVKENVELSLIEKEGCSFRPHHVPAQRLHSMYSESVEHIRQTFSNPKLSWRLKKFRRTFMEKKLQKRREDSQLEVTKPLCQRMAIFKIRTLWTAILVFCFLFILIAGPFYTSLLVFILTMLVYREVIALKRNVEKDKKIPLFFVLRWYWFVLTVYGTGYSWILPLADILNLSQHRWIHLLVSYHVIITYCSAFLGLIFFILSLRRFSLRYQFTQFAILLLTCLFVVGQSLFQIANIYSGFIWFFMSCSCVIVNDIFAYLCGIFFGRTPLIKLSPKKTLEGFLGASVVTLLWSLVVSSVLSRYQVFVCPQETITLMPFTHWSTAHCQVHHVFKPQVIRLSTFLGPFLGQMTMTLRPAVLHCFVLGIFAAFFAPFGGFFASALKRSLRIKDFGMSIPGHGGITDRFDCQLMMGMFTFLYLQAFVFRENHHGSISYILHLFNLLSIEDKIRLIDVLQSRLSNRSSTLS